jgi:hypothetical protein
MTLRSRIMYLQGDATKPQGADPKLIIHICNTVGAWGRGFVVSVSRRWAEPERCYRGWHHVRKPAQVEPNPKGILRMTGDFSLGESQLVQVTPDIFVLNMIAQDGLGADYSGKEERRPPIRYAALALCLRHADDFARELGASIHAPRLGAGLSGGSWARVGPLLDQLISVSTPVFVYDFVN